VLVLVRLALVIRVHVIVGHFIRRVLMLRPVHVRMRVDVLMLVDVHMVVGMRVRLAAMRVQMLVHVLMLVRMVMSVFVLVFHKFSLTAFYVRTAQPY